MNFNVLIYILIMAVVTFAVRVVPLTVIRTGINNRFLKSFLYYVPYVTLSVMTFPAIMTATRVPIAGIAALIIGSICAWRGWGLFRVALCCCVVVLICELAIL